MPTTIVFDGSTTIRVDAEPGEVATALASHPWARLPARGREVWINPARVAYLEPHQDGSVALPDQA